MNQEMIMTLVATLLPSFTAIGSVIGCVITLYKKVKTPIETQNNDIKGLKKELEELLEENKELKKAIRLKIDKIGDIEDIKKVK